MVQYHRVAGDEKDGLIQFISCNFALPIFKKWHNLLLIDTALSMPWLRCFVETPVIFAKFSLRISVELQIINRISMFLVFEVDVAKEQHLVVFIKQEVVIEILQIVPDCFVEVPIQIDIL